MLRTTHDEYLLLYRDPVRAREYVSNIDNFTLYSAAHIYRICLDGDLYNLAKAVIRIPDLYMYVELGDRQPKFYTETSREACLLLAISAGNVRCVEWLSSITSTFLGQLRYSLYIGDDRITQVIIRNMIKSRRANDALRIVCRNNSVSLARTIIQTREPTIYKPWFRMLGRLQFLQNRDLKLSLTIPTYPNFLKTNIVRKLGEMGCARKKLSGASASRLVFFVWNLDRQEALRVLAPFLNRDLSLIVVSYMP